MKRLRISSWVWLATSAVYGMPKAAAKIDAAVEILALNRIAPRLVTLVR